jgi:hypothetical protein
VICSEDGCEKDTYQDLDICYGHKIRGLGFKFVGGGGYGRKAFHDRTIGEKLRETLGPTGRPTSENIEYAGSRWV